MLKIIGPDPDDHTKVVVKENDEVKTVDINTIYSCELEKFVTKMAYYAQQPYSDTSWCISDINFEPVAYALSCFFAQNTRFGDAGVDSTQYLIWFDRIKTELEWYKLISNEVKEFGGWNN